MTHLHLHMPCKGCEYHASQLEKLWSETPKRGKICELARDEKQLRMASKLHLAIYTHIYVYVLVYGYVYVTKASFS